MAWRFLYAGGRLWTAVGWYACRQTGRDDGLHDRRAAQLSARERAAFSPTAARRDYPSARRLLWSAQIVLQNDVAQDVRRHHPPCAGEGPPCSRSPSQLGPRRDPERVRPADVSAPTLTGLAALCCADKRTAKGRSRRERPSVMRVRIVPYAELRRQVLPKGQDVLWLDLPEGSTVADV